MSLPTRCRGGRCAGRQACPQSASWLLEGHLAPGQAVAAGAFADERLPAAGWPARGLPEQVGLGYSGVSTSPLPRSVFALERYEAAQIRRL